MKNGELAGVVVPVITPVDSEERVDEVAFRKGIRRLINAGVNGIFVGGSAGEGPLLMAREWERMVTIARDEVSGAVHLLGGAIDTSTKRVQDKIRILSQLGYPYCVVTPTYYITLRTPNEHLRLFGECAEGAGSTQIVAYNIPSCVGSVIPVEALIESARRGYIHYLKESSGDFDYFHRLVVEGREVGLKVLEGEEPHIAKGLLAGAVGIVPVCANFEPATYIAAYHAALERDEVALAPLQERILEVRRRLLFVGPLWIAGIKYAMSLLGVGSGLPVSPLQPLTAEQQAKVAEFTRQSFPGL
ncbi:MAG: dihydrodipicolinate synthase family protein [Chloroflexi bacterium]|nr:dihydrodipicolinate synthase family protein [Chloroflexota bacterium]